MINTEVLGQLPRLREQFQTARPFKHLCVDDFFEAEAAEKLLSDFPAFQAKNAVNEFGEVGGKATVPQLKDISPFYAEVHRYITSAEFLAAMSEMTGIPNLLPDPRMFGGGTHENRHGQGLDAHVDFNFQPDHGLHRRLNLILYLNKGWQESWGGAIQLHSDPWDPEGNEVSSFNCIFNRAVIFETNEYSWHGFPKIHLPEELRSTSRKSLSIYLYTEERPEEEIAPPHGTFYVPTPLSLEQFAGKPLTPDIIKAIQDALQERNRWIQHYQGVELRLSAEGAFRRQNLRAPVVGSAKHHGKVEGLFPDGWVEPRAAFEAKAYQPFSLIAVRGWALAGMGTPLEISLWVDGALAGSGRTEGGTFEILAPYSSQGRTPADPLKLEIRTERQGAMDKGNGDARDLAFILSEVDFVWTQADRSREALGSAVRAFAGRLLRGR